MNDADSDIIIESVCDDGQRFRPSDWVERISSLLARFADDRRLNYAEEVRPCMIEGRPCLLVSRALEVRSPQAYAHITGFARDNGLRIQVDRRSKPRD